MLRMNGGGSTHRGAACSPKAPIPFDALSRVDFRNNSRMGTYKDCMKKALLVLCLPFLASAADLSGKWVLRLSRFGEAFMTGTLELKAEGSKLTGSLNQLKFEGTVEGDRVSFTATPPAGQTAKLNGRIANEEMSGTGKT